jgi:hypothetical protein
MAAFGAAPLSYRPNQDVAEESGPHAASGPTAAPAGAGRAEPVTAPPARASDRILPGAGGRVREIFPLLSRAIPVVGDLKIGAIKRAGDEIPESREPETAADVFLAAQLQAAAAEPAPPPAPVARALPFVAAENRREPPVAVETAARAETRQQAMLTALPVPAAPASALQPLRSHAELIRPVATRGQEPAPPPAPPLPAPPQMALPVAQMPQPMPQQVYAPPPPLPQPAMAPPGYPPYYPPQAMPQPAAPPYPMHPGAAPWPPPPYPPPYAPPFPPSYPPPGAGYPAAHPPAYPPGYPYGYPQGYPPGYPPPGYPPPGYPPPGYGAPPYYPMPQQAPPEQVPAPRPAEQAAPAPPPPQSLSAIFAALQRARGAERGEETPQ